MRFRFAHGDKPIDGYTILRGVGVGGFGEVYEAINDAGKIVAIKAIRGDRFEVELRGVQQCINLKHPNLIQIYDIKSSLEGDHFVIMEYVNGESLAGVIDSHPDGMPLPEVAKWFRGIAAAVGYLHNHGIVHRDLKPQNIFCEDGFVKVGDYGLSKHITVSNRSGHTTAVGTVHYMAPEVGSGRYGHSIDIFAVGVLLYEMLTGRPPFDGESVGEILMRIATEEPDLSRLPPELRPVLQRALEKDPEKRYASMDEFLQAFDAALTDTEPVHTRTRPLVAPRQEPQPRGRPSTDRTRLFPPAGWNATVRTLLEAAAVAVFFALIFRLVTATAGFAWGIVILSVTLAIYLKKLQDNSSGSSPTSPPHTGDTANNRHPPTEGGHRAAPGPVEQRHTPPAAKRIQPALDEQQPPQDSLRSRLAHWAWITVTSPFFAVLGAAAVYLVTGAPVDAAYAAIWLAGATSLTAAPSVLLNWDRADPLFRRTMFWIIGGIIGALIPTNHLVLTTDSASHLPVRRPPRITHPWTGAYDYQRWWHTHSTEYCLLRVPRLELFPPTPMGSHLAVALAFATPFAFVPWPRMLKVRRRSRVLVLPLLGAILAGYIWLILLDGFVSTGFDELTWVLYLLLLLGLVSSLASPYRPDLRHKWAHRHRRVP